MRFTKIPLIATLMAVALSLLIVLPALSQTRDITDGRLNNVNITVGVFDDIEDGQLAKLTTTGVATNAPLGTRIAIPNPTATLASGGTGGVHAPGDPAFLSPVDTATTAVSPQDTLFRNTLYVSNQVSAYNTLLISFSDPDADPTDTATIQDTCVQVDGSDGPDATFTANVKNNRSNVTKTIELQQAGSTAHYQAFIKVVPSDGTSEQSGPSGPTWCADTTANVPHDSDGDGDIDADDTMAAKETVATSAVDTPVDMTRTPGTLGTLPAQQEIAAIFARHGDRLTVTVSGQSGSLELVVDGEGPDFTAVTPDDNAVTRSSRLTYGFEVRDDDSGLRHDGESVTSSDGDLTEINPDGDHALHSEPLSVDPEVSVEANGAAADIKVNVTPNTMNSMTGPATPPNSDDISASGTWRMAGNRAGVAYVFTASGAGEDEGPYLYQLRARDRAGNWTSTDAVADEDDNEFDEPYVFRVDNTDPTLSRARTGISYDTAKNVEIVDRSYIALDFNRDALGDVDMDNITVVGHTIVDVIHPGKAPVINRGEQKVLTAPTGSAPRAPGSAPSPVVTDPSMRDPVIAAPSNWDSTFLDSSDLNPASPNPNKEHADYATCTDTDTTNDVECDQWNAWIAYEDYESEKRSYDARKDAYDTYNQYARENPGRNIEDGWITEPRARVYVELAEELASDETPAAVVVGGAVYDLAGNTNDAKTIEKAMDWIAPSLTVTVTGTANDRPVASAKGAFSVDVRSDEDLLRRPRVFFVEIEARDADGGSISNPATYTGEYTYMITGNANINVDTASNLALQEDDNHWARSYKVSSIEGHFDGLIGVIVVGYDGEENIGATAGWTKHPHRRDSDSDVTPAERNSLNLVKMDAAGLLAEIDRQFNNGNEDAAGGDIEDEIGTVTPRSDDKGQETESANPFVKLDFGFEAAEYKDGTFEDSHGSVGVTEITLNGDNVMANLNRVSATSHSLITRDLEVGAYTVEYTAVDDAGNEFEGEFTFDVNERQPYEISVQPGWNLVSLPATPVEPAIGSVLANNQYISPVLGYQQGDWITAIREDDGTWRGRLMEIEGGYGYWVHARTFESIETMLSQVDPAGTLPTVPVTAGWNLLGVLDIFQNAENNPPGEKDADGNFADANYEADNYFSSIPWRVAYTYDTTQSLWVKATPGVTATVPHPTVEAETIPVEEIQNGKGYWVWSPTPSTLVP
ncbi:MAG: hypothetical protein OXE02_15565 [Chloroflexi bacterium]|nr:hypothetical protein [Chloroflexota bacterium]